MLPYIAYMDPMGDLSIFILTPNKSDLGSLKYVEVDFSTCVSFPMGNPLLGESTGTMCIYFF